MFLKSFLSTNIYFNWVNLIGLNSKMHSIKNIDGKESNTAKRVNIATEFNKFKHFVWQENNQTQKEK